MFQPEKAEIFAASHQQDHPLVLYNIWDAGGARTLVKAGAKAIVTGSWSMAAAHGFKDGENIPLDFVLPLMERICASVDVPVSVDFEGGYALAPKEVAENVRRIIQAGAVGLNFEDRVVAGEGLHSIAMQSQRISAIRQVAQEEGIALFINARTDLFLGSDPATHESLLLEAKAREEAYAEAGASGFFAPGLTDKTLIAELTTSAHLPVNVMITKGLSSLKDVRDSGISRLSYGPAPYFKAMSDLEMRFKEV